MNSSTSGHQVPKVRVKHLDGLRAIAVIAVIFFHVHANNRESGDMLFFPLFSHGSMGVQLFFAISGFVIALTLQRCSTPLEFAVRRLARLLPTMLLCSLITFGVLAWLNPKLGQSPRSYLDLIPSWTFLDAQLLERCFAVIGWKVDLKSMDAAYWSLWVEVRFYALAAVLYFWSKKNFIRNFCLTVVAAVLAELCGYLVGGANVVAALRYIFVVDHLPWFGLGIATFAMAHSQKGAWVKGLAVASVVGANLPALFGSAWSGPTGSRALGVALTWCVIGLFYLSFKWERLAALLSRPSLVALGVASYSSYLLHHDISVALMQMVRASAGLSSSGMGLAGLGISVVMLGASLLIFRFWETPAVRTLSEWLLRAVSKFQVRLTP